MEQLTVNITLLCDSRNVYFLVLHILQQIRFIPRIKLLLIWFFGTKPPTKQPKQEELN